MFSKNGEDCEEAKELLGELISALLLLLSLLLLIAPLLSKLLLLLLLLFVGPFIGPDELKLSCVDGEVSVLGAIRRSPFFLLFDVLIIIENVLNRTKDYC